MRKSSDHADKRGGGDEEEEEEKNFKKELYVRSILARTINWRGFFYIVWSGKCFVFIFLEVGS